MSKITVEELDIIVQASVEGAVKEFKKLLPEIQKQLSGIQKELDKVNVKDIKANIDFKSVTKEVQKAKKQIQEAFDPNDVSGIKINSKNGFQIFNEIAEEIEKETGKFKEYKKELSSINSELDKSPKQGKFIGYDSGRIQNYIDNYGKDNLDNKEQNKGLDVGPDTKSLSFWDTLKNKIAQAKKTVLEFLSSTKGTSGFSKMIPQLNGISGLSIKIKNQIKQWSTGFKNGLGHILKYAGALFSLKGIYSVLSGSASAWLSSQNAGAKQLSANIEYMKYSMGSVFAPVIQYVTNLIYQLMRAIQSVVYAFSGINIFAKATASSMKNTAGSAKQASRSLSSVHSEINNVSENNGNGGGGTTNPNIDLSKMDNVPNSITEAIKNGDWYEIGNIIGQKINEGLNNIPWDTIQNSARNIASAIGQGINGFVDGLDWSLLGSTIGNGINTAFTFVNTFLTTINWGSIGKAIADFINSAIATTDWNLIGTTIANRFNATINFAYNFVKEFDWKKFGKSITDGFNNAIRKIEWDKLAKLLSTGVKGILDAVSEFLKNLDTEAIGQAVIDFLTNVDWLGVAGQLIEIILRAILLVIVELPFMIGEAIGQKLAEGIDNAVEYVVDKAKENGGNVILGMLEGMAQIGDNIGQWIIDHIFNPFIDTFKNLFGIHSPSTVMAELGTFVIQGLLDGISSLVSNVTQIWENIKNFISNIINRIKDTISSALNTINSIWSNIWNGLKNTTSNIFNAIWNTIKGIINAILGGIEGMANGVVNGINTVIRALNGLKFKLPDFAGGREFSLNIRTIDNVSIPRLAKGGVLYDDTIVRAGEYSGASSNPEIVSPQSIMYDTMRRALEDTDFHSNGQPVRVQVYFGAENIIDEVIDGIDERTRNSGKAKLKVSYA